MSAAQDRLTPEGQAISTLLRSLINASTLQNLQFLFLCSDESLASLKDIHERLPGGTGFCLPSIGESEHSNFPVEMAVKVYQNPARLIARVPLNPMCQLVCKSTLRSLPEFIVQHYVSSVMAHWEGFYDLMIWARGKHSATVFKLDDLAIVAMEFDESVTTVGNKKKTAKTKLPDGLEITFELHKLLGVEIRAYHEPRATGLPPYDAYFVVTSHKLSCFEPWTAEPNLYGP